MYLIQVRYVVHRCTAPEHLWPAQWQGNGFAVLVLQTRPVRTHQERYIDARTDHAVESGQYVAGVAECGWHPQQAHAKYFISAANKSLVESFEIQDTCSIVQAPLDSFVLNSNEKHSRLMHPHHHSHV